MFQKVHHINFLVKDLDRAVSQYENLFGAKIRHWERPESRGVKTASFRFGEHARPV
jgi:predicted enzyme related to lactoylglutathione lyase